ncbi:MAG: tetratricopeptide repeat protein [Ignavibacteria bacterium]|nr:tetratricopeptide repeat protein [Ignavibacteria bacterium]
MNSFKAFVSLFVLVVTVSIYLAGCSPAETTTGKLAYNNKDWAKAETELTKGLSIDKSDPEAWYMLGFCQIELDKFDEATKSFKTCLSLSSEYGTQIKSFWIDKFNAGISDFNAATKSLGKKDTVSSNRSFNSAIKNFRGASSIIPDSISTFQLIADAYNYMGETEKALSLYQDILDKSKSKEDAGRIARIFYGIGIKERQQEKYDRAAAIFAKVLTIPYLPKDDIYYETSLFNLGFSNYQIAVKMATDGKTKADYTPYLNESVKYLEQLTASSKSKELLKDSYEILFNAYEALGNKEKSEDAQKKKNALQ